MSDPRFTDPRLTDPRDPNVVIQNSPLRESSAGGVWGWVAGLAVVALIAFVVLAGWNNSGTNNTAATNANTPPMTTGANAPVRNVTPPTTTGSGSTSPLTNPAPSSTPPAAPAR